MSDYAIFKSGSKQYMVKAGDVVDVELIEADKTVEFKDVLYLKDGKKVKVGSPTVAKAVVKAEVVDQVRGPKVISYKYKKRKNYRRKVGHRQDYTRVKITGVEHVS
ncbi:MAG: 50S ribosomal protein L21 [Chlamydiales bacterium]|nr:50S ribosomal protein L21 [Chlamydiales bacterium]MCH9619296.1 50S ribosomal protein L21 [Chlamydiales bacterium]MCH9622558.1 50S ribosomal protein L21 [Chlamydiales bacterium]